MVTPGAKPIIFFSMLALLEEGDEAIYPEPGLPDLRVDDPFAGATPVPIQLREEAGFALDVEELGAR